MKYAFSGRVRFSELGRGETLSLPNILNYFQDCSTFQSEELGVGLAYLEKQRKAWVLYSWQVEVKRYLSLGEELQVCTFASDFSGMYGSRNFLMKDGTGVEVAKANSLWVYMDLVGKRPTRPQAREIALYGIEEPLDMENVSRKIVVPKECEEKQPHFVRRDQIDTNHHVNNVQYVKMAMEELPLDYEVSKLRVEYKKAAVFGDTIVPRVAKHENEYIVALSDGAGSLYATVAFQGGIL